MNYTKVIYPGQRSLNKIGLSEGKCKNTYARWKKWTGQLEPKETLWKRYGNEVHRMLRDGQSWKDISAKLHINRASAINLHQRWKAVNKISGGHAYGWETLGPRIHTMREQSKSYDQIAIELERSELAVYTLYRRWRKRTATQEAIVIRKARWRILGPEINRLRNGGFSCRAIAERLNTTTSAVRQCLHYWRLKGCPTP